MRVCRQIVIAIRSTFSEDELKSYYEANLDRYRTPERVKLSYVLLDAATLAGLIDVNEEALRAILRGSQDRIRCTRRAGDATYPDFGIRRVRRKKRYRRPGTRPMICWHRFVRVVISPAWPRRHSDDPGSAGNGGDLGWVERGLMVAAVRRGRICVGQRTKSANWCGPISVFTSFR